MSTTAEIEPPSAPVIFSLDSDAQLLFEASRFASFREWPYDNSTNCSARKVIAISSRFQMAAAGFYYIGTRAEPDLVKCYVCQKEMDGWEPEDNPWNEHDRHTLKKKRKCEFMTLGKEEKNMTVEDFITLYKARMVNKAKSALDERLSEFDRQSAQIREELVKLPG